ncbi:MAG: hypothetical protein ACKO2V_06440 [Snowella sp.]
MAVTSLLTLIGLFDNSLTVRISPLLTLAQGTKTVSQIPVFLPDSVEVKLKGGRSLSGRITDFNAQMKKVTVKSGERLTVVAMKDVDLILFQGRVILRNSTEVVIRGDDSQKSPNQNGQIFKEPLKNFQIVDANKAKVTITSITNPLKLKGIIEVATSKDSSYVVEKIQFEPSDRIQVWVTPR